MGNLNHVAVFHRVAFDKRIRQPKFVKRHILREQLLWLTIP